MKNIEIPESTENNQIENRAVGLFEGKAGFICSSAGVLLLPLTISGGLVAMGAGTIMMMDSIRRLDKDEK